MSTISAKKIGKKYVAPLAVLGLMACFLLTYGWSRNSLEGILWICLLGRVFQSDLDHRVIPWRIWLLGIAVAVWLAITLPPVWLVTSSDRFSGIETAAIGGAIGLFTLLAVNILFRKEALGWGDVKLALLLGLITGYLVILVICLAGIINLLPTLARKKGSRPSPFGAILCLAAIFMMLLTHYV